jgi:hypothetical protein
VSLLLAGCERRIRACICTKRTAGHVSLEIYSIPLNCLIWEADVWLVGLSLLRVRLGDKLALHLAMLPPQL